MDHMDRGIMTTVHRRSLAALVLAATTTLSLVACNESGAPTSPSASASTPSPEEQATTAYKAYWDVYIQASTSGEVPSTLFEGVADGTFVETTLKTLGNQADAGVVRVGEPVLSDFDTVVDGTTASSVVCVDERKWGARSGEKDLAPPGDKFPPYALRATLEQRDGKWIVTDEKSDHETTCSTD